MTISAETRRELEVVSELSRKAVYENANSVIDQKQFYERNNAYLERFRIARERITELEARCSERRAKSLLINTFMQDIKTRPRVLEEFDEKMWTVSIDKVVSRK